MSISKDVVAINSGFCNSTTACSDSVSILPLGYLPVLVPLIHFLATVEFSQEQPDPPEVESNDPAICFIVLSQDPGF